MSRKDISKPPAIRYDKSTMYLLFDIGGTRMRFAVSHNKKTFGNITVLPTPRFFDVGISLFAKTAQELAAGEKIDAVAGGIAGPLNAQKSMLFAAPNMPDWVGKPLKKDLQLVTGTKVIIENDAAVEGLGEAVHGAGQQHAIVAYLTIGTGVGGVRIVNKKIDKNAMGFEPGHQIINITGDICSQCNVPGHLEEYIGGHALEKKYNKKPQDIHDPAVWDEVANYLAVGLHNTMLHWSPEIVVLGGSLMKHIPLDKVELHLNSILTIFPGNIPIEKATLGDASGMYGALSLLKR